MSEIVPLLGCLAPGLPGPTCEQMSGIVRAGDEWAGDDAGHLTLGRRGRKLAHGAAVGERVLAVLSDAFVSG